MRPKSALIVVDLQRDFCPGGALPVRHGDKVVQPINALIKKFEERGLPVIFTRDWHPRDHCSFTARGGTWPPHAVKGSLGAQFHPSLEVPRKSIIISKATRKDFEAYSGFEGTDLAGRLRALGASDLYVTGLATDYCVKNTVIDGLKEGFRVFLVKDCVKGVNLKRTDSANAYVQMLSRGARTTTSEQQLRSMGGRVAVSSSS